LDEGGEIWIGNNPELLVADFPALKDGGQYGCSFTFFSNAKLRRVSAPLLPVANVDIQGHPALEVVELRALAECSVMLFVAAITELLLPAFASGSLNMGDLQQLETLFLPLLTEGDINLSGPTRLTSLELPELTTVYWGLNFPDHALLTNVSLPKLATAGSMISFSRCALTVQSVNHILAKAAGDPTFGIEQNTGMPKSVDLSGGTNAAPTGQGLVDRATLIARGATITTN
jgi:hypothetical protein